MGRGAKRERGAGFISDASALWNALIKHGLKPDGYDEGIVVAIQTALGLDRSGILAQQLQVEGIAAERFLLAFIDVLEPFAQMMEDSLHFLEQFNTTLAIQHLAIQFKGLLGSARRIDLDRLRRSALQIQRVKRKVQLPIFNSNMWAINRPLSDWTRQYIGYDNEVERLPPPYLNDAAALAEGPWPRNAIRRPPVTGRIGVDANVERLCELVDSYVASVLSMGYSTRAAATDAYFRRNTTSDLVEDVRPQNLAPLAQLASDDWAGSLYRSLVLWTAAFADGITDTTLPLDTAIHALDQFPTGTREKWTEEPIRVLLDILDLPVWKHRHELYAFWVLTEIARALSTYDFSLIAAGGSLDLKYKATVVGTIRTHVGQMYLMSEVRTRLDAPTGRGRKSGVQPDYQISFTRDNDPSGARLLVECKQYATPRRDTFARMLYDYARACQDANVILVNYGRMPSDLLTAATLARLDPSGSLNADQRGSVIERTGLVGELKPGNAEARRLFGSYIIDALPAPQYENPTPQAPSILAVDISPSMTSRLDIKVLRRIVSESFGETPPVWIVAVDSHIRRIWRYSDTALTELSSMRGSIERLGDAIQAAGIDPGDLFVVTDDGGASTLHAHALPKCVRCV